MARRAAGAAAEVAASTAMELLQLAELQAEMVVRLAAVRGWRMRRLGNQAKVGWMATTKKMAVVQMASA